MKVGANIKLFCFLQCRPILNILNCTVGICEPLDDPKCQELNDWELCTAVEFECKYFNTTPGKH